MIDCQFYLKRKGIAALEAVGLIVSLASMAGCSVDPPPEQERNASLKRSASAAEQSTNLDGASRDALKIEVIGAYRIGDVEYVQDQFQKILPDGIQQSTWSRAANRFEYEVSANIDADALAREIRFGRVFEIRPDLIRVEYSYDHEVPARFKNDVADWRKPPEDELGPALEKHDGDWWKALGEIRSVRMRKRNQHGEIIRLGFLGFYSANDETLRHVANLQSLKELSLSGCRHVTDEGARYLSGLTNLEELDLSGTSIGNAGQTHLSSLTGLKRLELSGCGTEAGLKHLTPLTRLEFLSIGYSSCGPNSLTRESSDKLTPRNEWFDASPVKVGA